MFCCFRTGCIFLFSIFFVSYSNAQPERPLELNGVLYEVVSDVEGVSQQAFLWSLELEELSRSYELIVNSVQQKRATVLFFSETSGRDWRRRWGERMQLVYVNSPEIVNDHAEGFFSITGGFPETFKPGDQFSLETTSDGATRAYLNDKMVAQSLKPGHFEFWLRAWNTGLVMPEKFRGNLLAGGFIPDDLAAAYRNSELPRPVRVVPEGGNQNPQTESVGMIQVDESASINVENIVEQAVVPVILENYDKTVGL